MVAPSALGARHPEVARLRRLLRHRAERAVERAFVIEGPKAVADALDAGADVDAVFVADGHSDLAARAADAGVRVRLLDARTLQRVASTVTPQPVLAIASSVDGALDDLRTASFLMVAVDLQDPGNAGTLIRSAVAAGADGVVLTGSSVDVHNPKTVRASAGSLFRVGLATPPDTAGALATIGSWGMRRLGAIARGGEAIDRIDLTGPVAVVVGNEAHGLAAGTDVDQWVSIPMPGPAESLNVGMAGTLLAFEVARQRRGVGP